MPGLVGVVQKTPALDVQPVFERLLASMQRDGRLQREIWVASDSRWALGRVHLGITQLIPQLTGGDDVQVVFHGDLYNETELRAEFDTAGVPQPGKGVASLLTVLYRLHGRDFVSRLHGAFCAAVLDAQTKQLILINDRLGSYCLYWCNGPQRFLFATSLKAILQDPTVRPRLNPRAVADYITFGFLLGDKTLDTQVRLLPAASTLTYRWEEESCILERYWRLDAAFQSWEGDRTEYLQALRLAFNRAVQRTLMDEQRVGIALSGGLDSRAILSAIDCTVFPVSTYTLGVKGCADEVIATKLAKIAGAQHRFFELNGHYLEGFARHLQTMVDLTDGMYLTHGLTEMLALRYLAETDYTILLRGHGAELAKASLAWPFHTDAAIYHMHSTAEFLPYMLRRANYISGGIGIRDLFSDTWYAQVEGGAQRSLEESLADTRLAPPDLCSYLYLTEHHRRFTTASLELFRTLCEVRMPFVDVDFLTLLFRGPSQWRDDTTIHRAIIGGNRPALLRVRNSNTGAPGNAGPFLEAVLDKLNSLVKRWNLYGYRHYHSFENWMKTLLITAVESVLLAPDSMARGIYREATLRRLLEETRRGVADHGYLLQILLILELWQRQHD
jgi:asparagine synthase (glutamine-hydrolysing)